MSQSRKQQIATIALVLGAVAFGMVLASGANLTAPAFSESTVAPQAVQPTAAVAAATPAGFPNFADLAEAVQPAVVSIRAISIERGAERRGGGQPFEFFFGPRGRPQDPNQEFRSDSGGSGFVVSADGLIVTNYHVVEGATELRVHLNDRDYPAEVRGTDPETDIALLKIDLDEPLRYLALGDSDPLRVGEWIMAIGSPLQLEKSVTVGVVSAKGRSRLGLGRDNSFENFIQTDAAINFGNSGGPLVNLKGEVVGVATAINYGAENIGFAVPVNTVKQILPHLRDHGRVRRGYMGVNINDLDFRTAEAFGLPVGQGVLVEQVTPDTPAEKAGLKHGDIILKVDGRGISDTRELIDYVSNQGPEGSVELEIRRGEDTFKKKVALAERPGVEEAAPTAAVEGESGIEWLGLDYQDITPGMRQQIGIPDEVTGVFVTDVEQTSPLWEENVRRGSILVEVNGQPTPDVAAFERAVRGVSSGGFLRIYVVAIDRSGDPAGRFAFVRVP
jgi:serine protease Do